MHGNSLYQSAIEHFAFGFPLRTILTDDVGNPADYEYLGRNKAFGGNRRFQIFVISPKKFHFTAIADACDALRSPRPYS